MWNLSEGILGNRVPFAARLGLVTALAVGVASCELLVRGRRATRWREYLILGCGTAFGAALGIAIDAATSTISAEYFASGKGLGAASGLTLRAIALGARAGCCAGALVTGLLLLAAGPLESLSSPALRRIASGCASVAAGALTGATLMGLASWNSLRPTATTPELRFVLVFWIHAGAYLGAIARVVPLVWRERRVRSRLASQSV
jgi:hypothetical protein